MEVEQTGPLDIVHIHNQCFFNNIITPMPFLSRLPPAGRLLHCIKNWQALTTNPWVLQVVRGYRLELMSPTTQRSQPVTVVTEDKRILVGEEVQKLLNKGAIKVVSPCPSQFVSRIFVVLKKDGSFKPVVNLKPLNRFMVTTHFKMESLPC